MPGHSVLIALGANIPSHAGAPQATLRSALEDFRTLGVSVRRISGFYRSPAWPDPEDPAFVNAVAGAETSLSPQELMRVLHQLETAYGRTRSARNAPRTLDLDILDYEGRVEEGSPVLPHPRMEQRAFVLLPLAEVEPGWVHPVSGKSVQDLVAALPAGERAQTVRL